MSNYIVSARKYRPTNFDSVVGQSALTTTLKNAIATGKLAHAYLFCGPRGVGKTTSARIFAKTINCLTPNEHGEACDHCESCVAFNEGRSYNIHELDAASNNSVDDIRALIEQVQIPPQIGRYKVFIIDEVHMLSQAGFNAFLKTLEEPPAHAIFILATTEKHKILPTILSRCQIYDFARMEVPDVVAHLKHVAEKEGYTYEETALNVIARKADGGMRDALSIFDQVAAFTSGNITYRQVIENLNVLDYDYYFDLTDTLLQRDIPKVMLTLNEILSKGFEANHFMSGLAAHFRDLLVSRDAQTLPLLEVAETVRQRYAEQAQRCAPTFLYRALKLCNDCDINYRASNNKRLLVELTLIQVAQLLEDDGAGSGLGPTRRLLPIFSPAPAPQRAAQPAPAPAAQPVQQPVRPLSTTAPQQQAAALVLSPQQQAAIERQRARLRTVSLNRRPAPAAQAAAAANETADTAPPKEKQNKEFTYDDLCYQLMRFANLLPREYTADAERLKVIATDASRLKLTTTPDGFPHISALVEYEAVKNELQQLHSQIYAHLCRKLHNDFLQFQFEIAPQQIKRRAYLPREIYQQMLEKSEPLQHLAKALHLRLV